MIFRNLTKELRTNGLPRGKYTQLIIYARSESCYLRPIRILYKLYSGFPTGRVAAAVDQCVQCVSHPWFRWMWTDVVLKFTKR